jgi:sugar transferase (PEP-CTERM/EpsH1 system associated)
VNILFLCHRLPYPPNKGDKIRAYNILKHLSSNHTVYLGTFVDDAQDKKFVDVVKSLVGGRCNIQPLSPMLAKARMVGALLAGKPLSTAPFYSAALQSWIDDLLVTGNIDRVVIFGSAMAAYLLRSPKFTLGRVVFDMVDIDSDKWAQYSRISRGALRWLYKREARTLFQIEREAAQRFGSTLLVSPYERDTFAQFAPETRSKLHVGKNGVDLGLFAANGVYFDPFGTAEHAIVMTGRMDYRPNIEGAKWFAERVFPRVLARLPSARFYIVGAKPPRSLKDLASECITVTGAVEDIRPYISHAAVVVAPLHQARGVQNKVLEALALSKPVVATTPSTRALEVIQGKELWIADTAEEFAAAVVRAATDASSVLIAKAGRLFVESHYQWARNLTILDFLLDTARTQEDAAAGQKASVHFSVGHAKL